jgi:hypothetical protein
MKRFLPILSIFACLVVGGALAVSSAAAHGTSGGRRRPEQKKPTAPSLSVIGFGVNRLFVPKNTTVSSLQKCADMVESDSLVGPPQQIYLSVFVRANGIPHKAPTQIKDTLPYGDDAFANPELTDPAGFSKWFAGGSFPFGAPPGPTAGLYHLLIGSAASEAGTYEGPSADQFNGEYSFTASVKVRGRTLTSTAKVSVDCPR